MTRARCNLEDAIGSETGRRHHEGGDPKVVLTLTQRAATVAGRIVTGLVEDGVDGVAGDGAAALDVALADAGCRGTRLVEIEERDAAAIGAALSVYERRHGGELGVGEHDVIWALRAAVNGAIAAAVEGRQGDE